MENLGKAKKIIRMEILRDRKKGTVWLNQARYLRKVMQRFGMDGSTKPVGIPLAPHFKLCVSMCPNSEEEKTDGECPLCKCCRCFDVSYGVYEA